MKLSTKVAELTTIIEPAVAACDVSLWGIEFTPQGNRSLLRIYIEALPEEQAQDKHLTIEDCADLGCQPAIPPTCRRVPHCLFCQRQYLSVALDT